MCDLFMAASLGMAITLAGCTVDDPGPDTSIPDAEQRVELSWDGETIRVAVERWNHWLTEDDDAPERFEVRGPGVHLVGVMPDGLRVDYGDAWAAIVGKELALSAEGGLPGREEVSRISLPGKGDWEVAGGWIKVEPLGKAWDARMPLRGKIRVELKHGRTLDGTFQLNGTTWG